MTAERPFAQVPVSGHAPPGPPSDDPISLQILATEHWSLLATRSLTWNESFSRTGMFFTVLSASVVALALIAQATAFGEQFIVFAVVLLPVVLFVGVTTFFRVVAANNEDGLWLVGMNRLRAAYIERRPDLARYFITGYHDDAAGLAKTFGTGAGEFRPIRILLHGFVTTPSTLATVVSVVAGVLAGVVGLWLDGPVAVNVVAGIVVFVAAFVLLMLHQFRAYTRTIAAHTPLFPTPPG